MVSESAATQFSLEISESTRTLCVWRIHPLVVETLSLIVNWDFVRWRIHPSTVEAVSLMVSESAATQLSVMISESTGTVCANESRIQLVRQSRWCFLSHQQLIFCLQFWSQQGLCALMNPRVSCGSSVVDGCMSRQLLSFWWWFSSQSRLCARTNSGFNCEGSLVDAFWVGSDLVFGCDFRVN
jgi:hypothetical protein